MTADARQEATPPPKAVGEVGVSQTGWLRYLQTGSTSNSKLRQEHLTPLEGIRVANPSHEGIAGKPQERQTKTLPSRARGRVRFGFMPLLDRNRRAKPFLMFVVFFPLKGRSESLLQGSESKPWVYKPVF